MAIEYRQSLLSDDNLELSDFSETNVLISSIKQNMDIVRDRSPFQETEIIRLVKILGGIEKLILAQIPDSQTTPLSNKSLRQINEILIAKNKDTEVGNSINPHPISDMLLSPDADYLGSLRLQSVDTVSMFEYVNERNTFLHRLCCSNHKDIADALMNLLFGPYIPWIWGFFMIILVILTILDDFHVNVQDLRTLYKNIFFVMISLPFSILWCLALNKRITRKIMRTFEFWFKFYYFLRYWVSSSIYTYRSMLPDQHTTIAGQSILDFTTFSLFIIYCFMDGLNLSNRFKMSVLTLGSVYMTTSAINWTFFKGGNDYPVTLNFGSNVMSFDVKTLTAASLRTVVIFMWKQTIYAWWKPNKSTYGIFKHSMQIKYNKQ